jgi:hypothetical protein
MLKLLLPLRVSARGEWGDKSPPSNDPPPPRDFFGTFFSGVENLITLSVILRHLEAELIILMCLKLIRGLFPL